MSLFGLADQEAVKQWCIGILLGTPRTCRGYVGDDRIGAHRKSTNSVGSDVVLLKEFENGVAGQPPALRM